MPYLGTVHMAATPANIHSPETSYSPGQCGRSHCGPGEKEKAVSNQKLSMKQKLSFLGSAIAIALPPVKVNKQKTNKKHNDSESILVRAFTGQGKEFHIVEAKIIRLRWSLCCWLCHSKVTIEGNLVCKWYTIWQPVRRCSLNSDYSPKELLLVWTGVPTYRELGWDWRT